MSNIYYVYAYIHETEGTPYYIGKGCRKRIFRAHGKVPVPEDRSKIVFLETNLTELGAYALERRYIRWYGRKDIGTGILMNRTNGGEGTSGSQGIKRPDLSNYNRTRKHPFQGKYRPDHSKRMKGSGNSNYGKKTSPEKAAKIRESLRLFHLNKKLASTDSVLVVQQDHDMCLS